MSYLYKILNVVSFKPKKRYSLRAITKTNKCLLMVILCSITIPLFAQKANVKAIIVDTAAKRQLEYAVVALFNAKDSLLEVSTRTAHDGSFLLTGLKSGTYSVLITYPQMADFLVDVNLKDGDTLNLGKVIMTSKYKLLEEVKVMSRIAAIRMKGDTLEYKADSFAVKPGASVEELLKRLPGIEVNKDGSIKAQGEKVARVLVDGDEFFGDDPTLATKYLQAKGVDKIQVYDKKSDQSTFTGIDDGKRSKTINIKLKENSKNGYFGKLSAGTNAKDYYNNEGMFNRFKRKLKFSVFGVTSNTGKVGLSYQDRSQYLTSDNERIDDQSGSLLFSGNSYDGESYYGSGLPTSIYTGAQFSNKWNEDKQKLNGNYRYKRLTSNAFETDKTIQILPDSSVRNSSNYSTNSSWNFEHKVAVTFDTEIDSFASVKVYVNGDKIENASENISYSETIDGSTNKFLNKSNQNTWRNGNHQQFDASVLWRQKFRKIGRTLSLNTQYSNNKNLGQIVTEASNQLYDTIINLPTTENPNQLQKNNSQINALATKLAYSDLLFKKINIEVSYAFKITNTNFARQVFTKNTNGKYDDFIDSLSSNYQYKILSHMPSLIFQLNKTKYNITLGGKLGFTNLEQSGTVSNFSNRRFVNFFPQTSLRFNIKQTRSVSFTYNGRTQQPSITELQPLVDKSNSLSESIGNPNLKPSFTHSFSLNFNDYNMATGSSLYGYASYSFTQNSITSSAEYGQFNKVKYQYINVDGSSNGSAYVSYNRSIKKLNLRLGVSVNASVYNRITFINNIENTTSNRSVGVMANINYDNANHFILELRSSFNYNTSNSSTVNVTNTHVWSHDDNLEATVFLPFKVELTTDVDVDFQPYNPVFKSSNTVVKWNATLSKKLTKDGKTELKIAVFDILNQNIGYSRYASGNYISESSSNYIPRYGLLSLTWNFTHMKK